MIFLRHCVVGQAGIVKELLQKFWFLFDTFPRENQSDQLDEVLYLNKLNLGSARESQK